MPKSPEGVGCGDSPESQLPQSNEVQIKVPRRVAKDVRACLTALQANFGSGLNVDVDDLERRLAERMTASDRLNKAE